MDPATGPEPVAFASTGGAVAHVFADVLAESVLVDGEDGHHLQRVRRIRAGERVTVSDGFGRWCPYDVAKSDRGSLVLRVAGVVAHEPRLTPGLAVAIALSKGTKPEHVVAGLTELGVDRIVPFRSARSVVRWEGERARSATARLRRVAREASMQCRRSWLPQVDEPVGVAGLGTPGSVVVGDPGGVPVGDLALPVGGEWLAVVGAEGGLEPAELAELAARPGATLVAVGPHVLRTETAALAMAAALAGRRTVVDGH
ncbi:MAG: RsmE family RNA methyltransferase [Acidimicrobiia bacterium]|jgi:16S rRNA (uracil1498-N3)-methyltransferase